MRITISFGGNFYIFLAENDPSTLKEVMTSQDAYMWREAINSELNTILSNNVYE